MDEKNLITAFILIAAFLVGWSVFVVPRFAPPPPVASHSVSTGGPAAASVPTPAPVLTLAKPTAAAAADQVLKNERNEIVLTSQNAGVRHWWLMLKGQKIDLVDNPVGTVENIDSVLGTVRLKEDVGSFDFPINIGEIILRQNIPVHPSDLQIGDSVIVQYTPLTNFPAARYQIAVKDQQATWQTVLPGGVRLTKTLTLAAQGFLDELTFQFDNPSSQPVEIKNWHWGWGPGLGTSAGEHKENGRVLRALWLEKLQAHKLKPGDYPGPWRWAGIDNRYFLVAFIPISPADFPDVQVSGAREETQVSLRQTLTLPPGQTVLHYHLYAGPKGFTHLKNYGQGLEEAVDFGFFSFLGRGMLQAMGTLEKWTGNYGWAIVIMTIILQIVMSPLTLKSFKAAIAMKKLQPQIAALQKNLKDDPKRLNAEMMNLYRKSGTNPFGGCLPMVVQLPIFWALFTALRNAYELRGAPFIGWIHDLSAADPYHALPLLMGGAMFSQQRMSGAVTDPTQKQMMFMMPIMLTFMFWNLPSGLVLYYFINNLLTMGSQWAYQRHLRGAAPASR